MTLPTTNEQPDYAKEVRADPVFVCSGCGNGFLRYPGDFDPFPKWWLDADIKSGGPCGGTVIKASKAMLIRNLERMEHES